MIITDKDAQKAFDYLKGTEAEYSQAEADYDALKKHENALIATLKLKSAEKTSAAKEDIAYASEEYRIWEEGMKEANHKLLLLKNRRDRAFTAIELYRTESANNRRL